MCYSRVLLQNNKGKKRKRDEDEGQSVDRTIFLINAPQFVKGAEKKEEIKCLWIFFSPFVMTRKTSKICYTRESKCEHNIIKDR